MRPCALLVLSFGLWSVAADTCDKAFYHEVPALQVALTAQTDLQDAGEVLAAFVIRHSEDVRKEGFSADPGELLHCLDGLLLASLVCSVVQELTAFSVARRWRWLRVFVLRAGWTVLTAGTADEPQSGLRDLLAARFVQEERGVAAFVNLARPPVPRILPAVQSALMELTRMLCLEFRAAPSAEQLNLFQQAGLLRFVGAVGSPATPLLRSLVARNGLLHDTSCKATRLPFTLGFLDGWDVLPLHPERVLEELRVALGVLVSPSVSAVSMRQKLLDGEYSSRYLKASMHGYLDPLVLAQLAGLQRRQHSMKLVRLLRLFGFQGEDQAEIPVDHCGLCTCYSMEHRLSDLCDGDVYLYRTEDAGPEAPGTPTAAAQPNDDWGPWYRALGWGPFLARSTRSYAWLAEARHGLFRRTDDLEVYEFSAIPVAVAAGRPEAAAGVVLLPLDFFGRCREQFSWLLIDLMQVLVLILNQGFENVTLVEPLLHHVVQDALYMHAGQWSNLTASQSEEEAVREVCQLSEHDETFRFAEVFDVEYFQRELQPLGVERTVGFDSFLEEGGVIDTLFLLNTAFQPGGAWVRHIFAEPLLHCQDDAHFNRVVKAYDGREVFVKRVICIGTSESNTSIHLDAEKFKRALLDALKYGNRLGFQLYFWSGPERTRFKLHLGHLAWLPSLWRTLRLHPSIEEQADRAVRAFLEPGKPFVAVHWRKRDLSAGGLMEYYENVGVRYHATASVPLEIFNSLTSCAPKHLRCADLFVMTHLAHTSDDFRSLQALHASDCGPNRLHSQGSLGTLKERPRGWGKLHGLLLDMAISSRANFFLGGLNF